MADAHREELQDGLLRLRPCPRYGLQGHRPRHQQGNQERTDDPQSKKARDVNQAAQKKQILKEYE